MIIQELKQFALLQGFSDTELEGLANIFIERNLTSGEFLFHENDASTEIYFIRSGQIEVCRLDKNEQAPQTLATLGAGDEVGELALIDGSPRSASARVLEATQVWVLQPERLPLNLMLLSRLISNIALAGTRKLRAQKNSWLEGSNKVSEDLAEELQQFSLLYNLSPAELDTLVQELDTRQLQVGEYLFHENDIADNVYFIRQGKIEISKSNLSGEKQIIATLRKGQEVGELALVDGEPRSASAYAASDSEVFVLNTSKLPNNLILLSRLIGNLTKACTTKLRNTNIDHVQSLERELTAARLQNAFGQFFVYILAIFTIGTFSNHLLHTYLQSINVYGEFFKWAYLFVLLVPSLLAMYVMKIPLANIGLTLNNWKKSLTEGIVVSIGFILLFIGFVIFARWMQWLPEKPLHISLIGSLTYSIHSFLQEILARGITQSSFQRFFNDKRGIKAVLLTSLCFGLFHIHFGLIAVFITLITSIFFGFFYLRHLNLIGVTIIHAVTGISAFSAGVL